MATSGEERILFIEGIKTLLKDPHTNLGIKVQAISVSRISSLYVSQLDPDIDELALTDEAQSDALFQQMYGRVKMIRELASLNSE